MADHKNNPGNQGISPDEVNAETTATNSRRKVLHFLRRYIPPHKRQHFRHFRPVITDLNGQAVEYHDRFAVGQN